MRNTGCWLLTNMIQKNPRNTIDKPVEMTGLELLEVSLHWKLQSSCLVLLLFTLPCHLSLMITTDRQRSSSWLTSTCSFLPGTDPLLVGLPPAPLLLHGRRRSHPLRQGGAPGFSPVLLISSFPVLSKSQPLSKMSKKSYLHVPHGWLDPSGAWNWGTADGASQWVGICQFLDHSTSLIGLFWSIQYLPRFI